MKTNPLHRLDDFDAERAAGRLVMGAQLARDAQIVLLAVEDRHGAAVDDIHVAIDAHGELQRRPSLAVGRGEPQPVEEARIAGADMIESRRQLVPEGIVELSQHAYSSFAGCFGAVAVIAKGKRSARSRKSATMAR